MNSLTQRVGNIRIHEFTTLANTYQVCTSFLLQVNDFRIQLLVAVVNYRVKLLKAPRRGLCSNFLSRLREGDRVPIWTKAGTLKFPKEPSIPGLPTKFLFTFC